MFTEFPGGASSGRAVTQKAEIQGSWRLELLNGGAIGRYHFVANFGLCYFDGRRRDVGRSLDSARYPEHHNPFVRDVRVFVIARAPGLAQSTKIEFDRSEGGLFSVGAQF